MVSYTTTAIISIVISSCTAIILAVFLSDAARKLTRQPAKIAIFAQLLFCFIRNLTIIISLAVPGVNCGLLTVIGFTVYSFWIVSVDCVLLFRSRAFTNHPKYLTAGLMCLSTVQLGIEFYIISTIRAVNEEGDFCAFIADFSFGNYSLTVRTLTDVYLLVPFILKAYECWKLLQGSQSNEDAKKWMRMSVNNTCVTAGIIFAELMSSVVSQVPIFFPYISAVFAIANLIESALVLFLIDDLRKTLTGRSGGVSSGTGTRSKADASKTKN